MKVSFIVSLARGMQCAQLSWCDTKHKVRENGTEADDLPDNTSEWVSRIECKVACLPLCWLAITHPTLPGQDSCHQSSKRSTRYASWFGKALASYMAIQALPTIGALEGIRPCNVQGISHFLPLFENDQGPRKGCFSEGRVFSRRNI